MFLDRVESMLVGDLAHLRPDRPELDGPRALWLLSLALEAAEGGERRVAASMLADAVRLSRLRRGGFLQSLRESFWDGPWRR